MKIYIINRERGTICAKLEVINCHVSTSACCNLVYTGEQVTGNAAKYLELIGRTKIVNNYIYRPNAEIFAAIIAS